VKTVKSSLVSPFFMKLSTEEAEEMVGRLDFKREVAGMRVVVAIARDWSSGDVLMQAYMNRQAALKTLTEGLVTYWSTSRHQLWTKGETSGFTQRLMGFSVDCDGDALLLDVDQKGPACHTGLRSCFDTYRRLDTEGLRKDLAAAIRRDALTFGEFTLTSGRKSHYYLDIKKITTRPEILSMVSHLIAYEFADGVDVVAGPELGAIPIVVAVALRKGLPYAMIRKGDRAHGTLRRVEGRVREGDRVLLIDDVTTSGGSLVGCVESLREEGAKVKRVTCVVDRREGASQLLRERCGLELRPLLTIGDLGINP